MTTLPGTGTELYFILGAVRAVVPFFLLLAVPSSQSSPSEGDADVPEEPEPNPSDLPGMIYRRETGEDGSLIYCNPYTEEFFGYSPDELLSSPQMPFYRLIHPDDRDRVRQEIQHSIEEDGSYHVHYRMLTRQKQIVPVSDRGQVRPADPGESGQDPENPVVEGIINPSTTSEDPTLHPEDATVPTARKYDFLTDLPNRHWFLEQIDARIQSSKEDEASSDEYVLALLDLDDFQHLNDVHGRDLGDKIIQRIAETLEESLTDGTLLGRVSGDRFGIFLPSESIDDLPAYFEDRLEGLSGSYTYQDEEIRQEFCLGMAEFPEHSNSLEDLFTSANQALSRVKNDVDSSITVFEESDRDSLNARVDARERILDALESGRVEIYYQPVKDIRDRSNYMYEALLRIKTESGTITEPQFFKENIQDGSVSRRIDRWVIRQAIKEFDDTFGPGNYPRLAVNMFPASIVDSGFFAEINDMIDEYGFPASQMIVEIPETIMPSHRDRATQNIESASERYQFEFALDDFGVGHGSFKTLNTLPINYLKIDGSFVKDILSKSVEQKFVEMAAGLSKQMDLKIIGEWIENRQTAELLRELGVHYQQGYFYSDPSPVEAIKRIEST